jgi:hypothetical protein
MERALHVSDVAAEIPTEEQIREPVSAIPTSTATHRLGERRWGSPSPPDHSYIAIASKIASNRFIRDSVAL